MNFCDLFHISIESHDFESRDFFTSIVQSLHQVHSLCLLIVFNYLFKCSMMLRLCRFFLSPSIRWKSHRPFLELAVNFSIHSHYFLSPFSNREKNNCANNQLIFTLSKKESCLWALTFNVHLLFCAKKRTTNAEPERKHGLLDTGIQWMAFKIY